MKRLAVLLVVATIALPGIAGAGSVEVPLQIGGAYSVPAVSMREARFSATVRQQFDFSCGSAALSTLLTHHYHYPITEETVFQGMYERGDQDKIRREGFSLLDMKNLLEAHDFESDGFEAPLDKLVGAGVPAIALINEKGYNHFVVIKGLRANRVLIGDPAGGTRAMAQATFDSIWVNQILFVITNRPDVAKFNLASDWRAVPAAPIGNGIDRSGLTGVVIPKHGPSDF